MFPVPRENGGGSAAALSGAAVNLPVEEAGTKELPDGVLDGDDSRLCLAGDCSHCRPTLAGTIAQGQKRIEDLILGAGKLDVG